MTVTVTPTRTTRQTVITYLVNNIVVGTAYGPTIPAGYQLIGTADFNGDTKPDYSLFQAEHSPNSDLVSQQQYFYRRCLRANSSLSDR